jgi:hypothetical protein
MQMTEPGRPSGAIVSDDDEQMIENATVRIFELVAGLSDDDRPDIYKALLLYSQELNLVRAGQNRSSRADASKAFSGIATAAAKLQELLALVERDDTLTEAAERAALLSREFSGVEELFKLRGELAGLERLAETALDSVLPGQGKFKEVVPMRGLSQRLNEIILRVGWSRESTHHVVNAVLEEFGADVDDLESVKTQVGSYINELK